MDNRELAFTPAWRLREMIVRREVSPVELANAYLERIEALSPKLNAYLTVTSDEALATARTSERRVMQGDTLRPLEGIPVSIKDLELTKGIRTSFGSLIFKDLVPDRDSGVAERTRRAGAVILGKTNTPEFGLSGTTDNRLGDACRNPWDVGRTTGGSSGGAGAALAAGLCALATGSDAGGSTRIPASFCGVTGIKPTLGRIPRFGGVGRSAPNPIAQPGPMARTVKDVALFLNVLAGPDPRDPIALRDQPPNYVTELERGVKGLRVCWSPNLGYAAVDHEVAEAIESAAKSFQELGCYVEEISIRLEDPVTHFRNIAYVMYYTGYGHLLKEQAAQMTDYVRKWLEAGQHVKVDDFARGLRYLEQLYAQMADLMERCDLLLTPTMATVAFPIGKRPDVIGGTKVDPDWGFNAFNFVFNMSRQPAVSVPCGFSSDGLPIGLQIVGRWGEEALVLRAAHAFEQAFPWTGKKPPVS